MALSNLLQNLGVEIVAPRPKVSGTIRATMNTLSNSDREIVQAIAGAVQDGDNPEGIGIPISAFKNLRDASHVLQDTCGFRLRKGKNENVARIFPPLPESDS